MSNPYNTHLNRTQIPSKKEIEETIKNGAARRRAALYLRHTTTSYLFKDALAAPILNKEQEAALVKLISQEDNYRQYLGLYRKNRVFERIMNTIALLFTEAEVTLASLTGELITLNQIEATEEVINTMLYNLSPGAREEAEKALEIAARGSKFYASTIETDEEGFIRIDTSRNWRGSLPSGLERLSLEKKILTDNKTTQKRFTNFYSAAAGFKRMALKVKFPLSDIYIERVLTYEEILAEPRLPGIKYNLSQAREEAEGRTHKVPYVEKKWEKLLKEVDYLSFDTSRNNDIAEVWFKSFLEDWEELTGRRY